MPTFPNIIPNIYIYNSSLLRMPAMFMYGRKLAQKMQGDQKPSTRMRPRLRGQVLDPFGSCIAAQLDEEYSAERGMVPQAQRGAQAEWLVFGKPRSY